MRILLAAAVCAALLLTSCFGENIEPESTAPLETSAASQAPEESRPVYLTQDELAAMPAGTLVLPEKLDPSNLDSYFTASPISDAVFARINGVSFQENPYVTRDDLRYLRVLHNTIDGCVRTGEIIVHDLIAEDVCAIMKELYEAEYPIEQMRLIDDYNGSDDESMDDNNSSGFNYRMVRGTHRLSKHAMGLALDINPLYNPYITQREGGSEWVVPKNGEKYTDRTADIPMKITKDTLIYKIFTEHGFRWGGTLYGSPDYMHFDREDLSNEVLRRHKNKK